MYEIGVDVYKRQVLPAEMGGISVPHAVGGARRVRVFDQHQTTRFLQTQLLLELHGAYGRDRFEVIVKAGDAHPQFAGKLLNA